MSTPLHVVYVLTNRAMPGLVKIGYTTQSDANIRIGQLFTTGVPLPFEIQYACHVSNPEQVERALHEAFAPHRINPKREFFSIEPRQAIAILKLLHIGEDVTQAVEKQPNAMEVDQISLDVVEQLKRKHRPRLVFDDLGIPVGAKLYYVGDSNVCAEVGLKNKVVMNGENYVFYASHKTCLKS